MEMYRMFYTFFSPIQIFDLSLYESWIDGQSDELRNNKRRS